MIPISGLNPKTEISVKNAIQKIAREAQPTNTADNYGNPTEAVENKLFPDPDGGFIYIYLNGVKYKIIIAAA